MPESRHPVITRDYPENRTGGIMVCGINFGYSKADQECESAGLQLEPEPTSFFSDTSVNKTRFRQRLLRWLSSWGVSLATKPGGEGTFERSFFQTNWLDSQTNTIASDGKITLGVLVDEAGSVLTLVEQRKPRAIMLVGADLINALNDMRLRERVESALGVRSGNATIHRGPSFNGATKRFKVLTQQFGITQVIGLPHVQAQGLTDDYMMSFGPVIKPLLWRA